MVEPEERAAAASVTNVPRSLASAFPPLLAGWMLAQTSFGWPLIIGGTLKAAYDLALLRLFRDVRPPEEQVGGRRRNGSRHGTDRAAGRHGHGRARRLVAAPHRDGRGDGHVLGGGVRQQRSSPIREREAARWTIALINHCLVCQDTRAKAAGAQPHRRGLLRRGGGVGHHRRASPTGSSSPPSSRSASPSTTRAWTTRSGRGCAARSPTTRSPTSSSAAGCSSGWAGRWPWSARPPRRAHPRLTGAGTSGGTDGRARPDHPRGHRHRRHRLARPHRRRRHPRRHRHRGRPGRRHRAPRSSTPTASRSRPASSTSTCTTTVRPPGTTG